MTDKASLAPDYFDDIYNANLDPWGFETRPYEAQKYEATLAALPKTKYNNALEIGCSIGVLTEKLAQRCNNLLSVDVAAKALDVAKKRCEKLPQVHFELMRLPQQFPDDKFDLILVSEVGYYWSWEDLRRAQQLIIDHLMPGGNLLLIHWTPFVPDYPLTGDEVHDAFLNETTADLQHKQGSRADTYRLDVFERK